MSLLAPVAAVKLRPADKFGKQWIAERLGQDAMTTLRRQNRRALCRSLTNSRSTPDRRRKRLRRWVRLIPGILNAKAAIARTSQLTLLSQCEATVLGATHPAPIVSAPRVDDHSGTWPRTCCQREDNRGHQTKDIRAMHRGPPEECSCSTAYTLELSPYASRIEHPAGW